MKRMCRQFFLGLSFSRCVLVLTILVLLYNEIFSYIICSWFWSVMQYSGSHREQVKVLFVADPQIQGHRTEHPSHPWLATITRYDADRYLSKVYSTAFSFVNPNVVIFLGDILDEGSIASDDEFRQYAQRFKKLFPIPSGVQVIYVAGDNDVGGEGFDPKDPAKISRFATHFNNQSGVLSAKFLDFVWLNYNFGETPDDARMREVRSLSEKVSDQKVTVLLNHMSFLDRYKTDFQPIIKDLTCQVIFTAHTHSARIYTCLDCFEQDVDKRIKWRGASKAMNDYTVYKAHLKDEVTLSEIAVPTCSYRMGVPNMAMGSAVFDSSGVLEYTLLWQPSRYDQLKVYAGTIVIVILTFTVNCLRSCFRHKRQPLLPLKKEQSSRR